MKDSKTGNDCNRLCFRAIAFLVVVGTLILLIFSSAVEGEVFRASNVMMGRVFKCAHRNSTDPPELVEAFFFALTSLRQ